MPSGQPLHLQRRCVLLIFTHSNYDNFTRDNERDSLIQQTIQVLLRLSSCSTTATAASASDSAATGHFILTLHHSVSGNLFLVVSKFSISFVGWWLLKWWTNAQTSIPLMNK